MALMSRINVYFGWAHAVPEMVVGDGRFFSECLRALLLLTLKRPVSAAKHSEKAKHLLQPPQITVVCPCSQSPTTYAIWELASSMAVLSGCVCHRGPGGLGQFRSELGR